MTKTKKTVVALLAIFAMGATAVAGTSLSKSFRSTAAFADSASQVDETTAIAGSEENPVLANAGENVIDYMVVGGNAEMGYKELVYYMNFTPAESGLYDFTHSNPDIGVGEIFSKNDAPYGEWNDDFTVYSIELTANVTYTVVVNNFDWMLDLTDYEVGAEYALASAETITISYASAADGSTREKALPYEIGTTIIVPQGHDPVWYTFEVTEVTEIYAISFEGSARIYAGTSIRPSVIVSSYWEINANGAYFIEVTPSATQATDIQFLKKADQKAGSCIVTAETLPENNEVGNNTWYTYTASQEVKASLTAVAGAEHVGSVNVYDGFKFIGMLSDGVFTPAVLPEVEEGQPVPAYTDVTLEAGKTYNFFAPRYEYAVKDEDGTVIEIIDVLSVLEIK